MRVFWQKLTCLACCTAAMTVSVGEVRSVYALVVATFITIIVTMHVGARDSLVPTQCSFVSATYGARECLAPDVRGAGRMYEVELTYVRDDTGIQGTITLTDHCYKYEDAAILSRERMQRVADQYKCSIDNEPMVGATHRCHMISMCWGNGSLADSDWLMQTVRDVAYYAWRCVSWIVLAILIGPIVYREARQYYLYRANTNRLPSVSDVVAFFSEMLSSD
jgi:hypothetical protein